MAIKIDVDAQRTIDNLREELKEYKKNLSFQIFRALSLVEKEIKVQIKKAGLQRRTGRLMNAWGSNKTITEKGNEVIGEMTSEGVPYAAIHEYGGTITPKSAKNLTIPTDNNRRADGSAIMTAKELFSSGKSFVRNGTAFMTESKGKIVPMFLLRKSVKIPARPYIRPALAATKDDILKNFGLFLSATFKGSE